MCGGGGGGRSAAGGGGGAGGGAFLFVGNTRNRAEISAAESDDGTT